MSIDGKQEDNLIVCIVANVPSTHDTIPHCLHGDPVAAFESPGDIVSVLSLDADDARLS